VGFIQGRWDGAGAGSAALVAPNDEHSKAAAIAMAAQRFVSRKFMSPLIARAGRSF
jgi:hypothetical protein